MFEETEQECPRNSEELLCSKFKRLYPNIYIGRPRRFYETVSRILAPTKHSLRCECKLSGSPLSSYRKRIWEPRIRNQATSGSVLLSILHTLPVMTICMQILYLLIDSHIAFPSVLYQYGLSEEIWRQLSVEFRMGRNIFVGP